jgi:hypothetical protein
MNKYRPHPYITPYLNDFVGPLRYCVCPNRKIYETVNRTASIV